jgi:hypothetical protein
MSEAFKPENHLRTLRGRGGDADYLDVKWRIVWLRHEHPQAVIETEKVAGGMESNYAEFRARVTLPGGGSATGWGSETKSDFADFIEKAETKALGRAIAALGYGTQFVGNELDENTRIVDSPIQREDDDGNAASKPAPPRQQSQPAAPAAPLKIPPSEANSASGTVGRRVNVEQPRPAPASNGTPAPAAKPAASSQNITDEALLDRIFDDTGLRTPDDRTTALQTFFNAAKDPNDLSARMVTVAKAGLPDQDRKAAYREALARLARRAPAPAAAPAAPPPH